MPRISTLFVVSPFDPQNRFFTSPVLPAVVLTAIRLVIATYVFATLIYTLAYSSIHNPQSVGRHWSYFTNITNWSAAFYFLFAGAHGVGYCLTGTPPLQRWPRWLQAAHGLLWTTMLTFPFLVTLVFWIILAPDDPPFKTTFDGWSNISTHALNSVWAIFELLFSAAPSPPWIHIPCLILFLAGYLGLAYVTHATQGFYTYGFLNPDNGVGSLVGYVFGILVGICVLFLIVWGIVWLRTWVLEKKLGLRPKRAARDHAVVGGKRDIDGPVDLEESRGVELR